MERGLRVTGCAHVSSFQARFGPRQVALRVAFDPVGGVWDIRSFYSTSQRTCGRRRPRVLGWELVCDDIDGLESSYLVPQTTCFPNANRPVLRRVRYINFTIRCKSCCRASCDWSRYHRQCGLSQERSIDYVRSLFLFCSIASGEPDHSASRTARRSLSLSSDSEFQSPGGRNRGFNCATKKEQ